MIKKYKKRMLVLTILLGVVLLIAGTTYAIFKASASQTTQNDITTLNCFEIEYSDVTGAIAITNDYPISDAEGLKRTPYTFKIKNKCTQLLNVQIGVETLTTSQIQPNLIKGVITNKRETPTSAKLLSDGIPGTPVNGGTNYILLEDTIYGSQEKEFDLRLWFTESMTKEQGSGKTYQGKVTVISSPKINSTVYGKLLADYYNNKGVKKTTDENGKEIYYYTGDITNNNLVLNNYCWKMVRTSETDGVKIIYNGVLNKISEINALDKNKYNITTNTPTDTPFTFDESTKKWTSGIAGVADSENIIEFAIAEDGNYILNYEVSSQENYDKVSFYKNGTELKIDLSGTEYGSIELNGLSTSDIIKVVYKKNSSTDSNKDMVSFSVGILTRKIITNCDNTDSGVYINSTEIAFNEKSNSLAYTGYMYGTVYNSESKDKDSYRVVNPRLFISLGSGVTWDGTTYKLSDAESSTFGNATVLNNKHYTCLSTSTSCETVYYVYYLNANSSYSPLSYVTLRNGKKIEDAIDEMLNYNITNSTAKTAVDNWYAANMINVTEYLENAIFCNNRNIYSLGGWNPNGGDVTEGLQFNFVSSWVKLTCQDKEDQFTLKVESGGTLGYGNNTLDYPIGLLTSKELQLANSNPTTNYLYNGLKFWLMNPSSYSNRGAWERVASRANYTGQSVVSNPSNIRPVVSLKQNILITGGTGEIEDPYTVALPD